MNNNLKYIYLYRHGETDWNVNDITMGQLEGIETEFTEKGKKEIELISEELRENQIEVIFCSDFKRTMETAFLASMHRQIPIIVTKEVRGLNMGIYQGQPFEKLINSLDAQESFKNYNIPFIGGESINELNARLIDFLITICSGTVYERIAIITHSAAISNLRALIAQDKYISSKMCCIKYLNGELSILDYIPVDDKQKEKKLEKRLNETK